MKEQDSFSFLVNQIDQAINAQNKGGNLICKVFGDKGIHTRSAIGVGSLPNNITVEIEAIVEFID